MRRTRIAALTAAGALVAAGTGVAVATTSSDDPKQREQAVLTDAAKRLDVEPSELRDALANAEDAQLDADVKAGRLTQEQADAIKQKRAGSGTVLGVGPGGPPDGLFFRHRGGPGEVHGPGELIDAAAKALGISREELFQRMRDGKSLSEIAKAEGKSIDDVKAAVKAAMKTQLDEAVKAGKLTQQQADDIASKSADHLEDFGRFPPERPHGPPGEFADAAAKALGLSREELFQRLRDGKSLSEIAKAQGKSVDDVKAAVRAAMKTQLDKAVEAGKLTRQQADAIISKSTDHLEDFGRFPKLGPPPEPPPGAVWR